MRVWRVRRALLALVALVGVLVVDGRVVDGNERLGALAEEPKLTLRASPRIVFNPDDVLFIGELRGGDDNYEELYCVSLEWVWDDDTRSQSTPDCEPYEPETSRIRRVYSMRHKFQGSGRYEVWLHLKQRDKIVSSARTSIEVRGFRN